MTGTQTTAPAAIKHWLRRKGQLATVGLRTEGAAESTGLTGRIDGWSHGSRHGARLIVTVNGTEHRIPAADLERHLDATGQTPQTRVYRRDDYCGGCNKLLDTGPLGHMDQYSGVVGLCFNCA